MTTYSTAHTTQARRTPPRPQEKKSPSNKRFAQVKIVSEPGKSITDFPDEGGDWYFFRVDHVNSNCKQWTINCREWQISWVIEQQGCNVQLCEGLHFHYVKGAVQVENGWEPRHVLDKDFHLLEPEPEEPPMTWSQPGQEVPVVVQPQVDNEVVALASQIITDWLTVHKKFEPYAGIPGFDDITFRATMGATISVDRKS